MGRQPAPEPIDVPESQPSQTDVTNASKSSLDISPAISSTDSKAPTSPKSSPSLVSRFAGRRGQTSTSVGSQGGHHTKDAVTEPAIPALWEESPKEEFGTRTVISAAAPEEKAGQQQSLSQAKNAFKTGLSHHLNKAANKLITQSPVQLGVSDWSQNPITARFDPLTYQQSDKADKSEKVDKTEKPEKPEKAEKPAKPEKIDKTEKLDRPAKPQPLHSDIALPSNGETGVTTVITAAKKPKQRHFGLLSRSRTESERPTDSQTSLPSRNSPSPSRPVHGSTGSIPQHSYTSTATMASPDSRASSTDRAPTRDGIAQSESGRDRDPRAAINAQIQNGGATFLNGLKNSSTKATNMISKGLFGKGGRSGSQSDTQQGVDDEHYVFKVINLPLVEQTRKTRISKSLEVSRDKTEFWMPAFPWRAIDYLNNYGCQVEGLYRVPGSGPQIRKWQRKFDELHDVNLFEEPDLYDINIVGSMLKAWLRELPDELLPKSVQDKVSRECQGAEKVPKLLVNELSNLPPYNYYLLFAITCHLSLLLANAETNKMDFRNLCICFQPCMKIDALCFKFLVCDWRDCWKGCLNEGKYIEEEYSLLDQAPPPGLTEPQKPLVVDPQAVPTVNGGKSSDNSPTKRSGNFEGNLQASHSNGSVVSNSSAISSTLSENSDKDEARPAQSTRKLSPIKRMSPIGLRNG